MMVEIQNLVFDYCFGIQTPLGPFSFSGLLIEKCLILERIPLPQNMSFVMGNETAVSKTKINFLVFGHFSNHLNK